MIKHTHLIGSECVTLNKFPNAEPRKKNNEKKTDCDSEVSERQANKPANDDWVAYTEIITRCNPFNAITLPIDEYSRIVSVHAVYWKLLSIKFRLNLIVVCSIFLSLYTKYIKTHTVCTYCDSKLLHTIWYSIRVCRKRTLTNFTYIQVKMRQTKEKRREENLNIIPCICCIYEYPICIDKFDIFKVLVSANGWLCVAWHNICIHIHIVQHTHGVWILQIGHVKQKMFIWLSAKYR